MKKQFVEFWKDYIEAQNVCAEFTKKHWKGQFVFSMAIGAGTMASFYVVDKFRYRKLYKQIESNEES